MFIFYLIALCSFLIFQKKEQDAAVCADSRSEDSTKKRCIWIVSTFEGKTSSRHLTVGPSGIGGRTLRDPENGLQGPSPSLNDARSQRSQRSQRSRL